MIRMIADSTCDISVAQQKEWGVEVAPLNVYFGEEHFLDGVNLDADGFYARLQSSDVLPTTAQINPNTFAQIFEQALAEGDQVVCITLSPKLSGTYQSANIAKELVGSDDIFVVDSTNVTFGMGLLIYQATRLRDQGLTAQELVTEIEALAGRLRFYAVVDTLKYLKLSGRISAATAVVGGMLSINPILNIRDGVVESAGKVRGQKAAYPWMEKRIAQEPIDSSLPVCVGHAAAPQTMENLQDYFTQRIEGLDVIQSVIGAGVGTHIGPGAAGIAYFCQV